MTDEKEKQEIATIDGCLPQELITEILLRLPVKSLVRFKLACKSWSTLISSYSFAKSHLQLNNPVPLLFVRGKRSAFSSNFYLKGVRDFFGSSVVNEGDITPLPSGSEYIMGLSHGLVCIKGPNDLIRVFNPTTKECRNVQFPCLIRSVIGYGFGFVPSVDEYKIVLLARCSEPSMSSNYPVYVFSSRDGQWRELDGSGTAFDALVDHPRNQSIGMTGGTAHAALWNEAFYWVVPVAQGSTSNDYVFIRSWHGQREQVMLIDANQEQPTYHLVTQKGFMIAELVRKRLLQNMKALGSICGLALNALTNARLQMQGRWLR
ncbi:hypothetical protein Cgig2_028366 [Carnegiea gigantea]|uniref:F-box domain-containing protein n=1 Tax=Carnegiea gigantea TaxID=171969 RepID=A0A9Q1QBV0_9CARY|nr:hypothetical protein Cgig2_028366 [Carnegiea gigantea]